MKASEMKTSVSYVDWQDFWARELVDALTHPAWWLCWAYRRYGGWRGNNVCFVVTSVLEVIVARSKQKPSSGSTSSGGGWTTFVDIPISETAWETVSELYGSEEGFMDGVSGILEDGYRLSLSYNAQNQAVICSVTCRNEESENNGKTFNAFASSWPDAVAVALYKHYVVASEKWSSVHGKSEKPRFG